MGDVRQQFALSILFVLLFSGNSFAYTQGICKEFYRMLQTENRYSNLRCWYGTPKKDKICVDPHTSNVMINDEAVGKYTKNAVHIFLGFAGDDEIKAGNGKNFIFGMRGDDILKSYGDGECVFRENNKKNVLLSDRRMNISKSCGQNIFVGGSGNDQIWVTANPSDVVSAEDDVERIVTPATISRYDVSRQEFDRSMIEDLIQKYNSDVTPQLYVKR